jgi:hypothetical protein
MEYDSRDASNVHFILYIQIVKKHMINIGKKSKDTANTVMGNRLKDFI